MLNGKVKWFSHSKGYGFITLEDQRDVFVHYSALQPQDGTTLAPGQPIEFEIADDTHGPHAAHVKPAPTLSIPPAPL